MLRPYVVPALLTASPVRSSRELTSKRRPWFFASIHCSPFFCPLPYLCKPSPTPPRSQDRRLGSVPGGTRPDVEGTGPLPFVWALETGPSTSLSVSPPSPTTRERCKERVLW